MGKQIWVSPYGDDWRVHSVGAQRASGIYGSKSDAVSQAKNIARNQSAELLIQRKDGVIQERNSYGNDPYPPKG